MKAVWKDTVIAESDATVMVEGNHYFPEASVNRQFTSFSSCRMDHTPPIALVSAVGRCNDTTMERLYCGSLRNGLVLMNAIQKTRGDSAT